jgi:hypothetical protein
MSNREKSSIQGSGRPSVYTLSDRQLADEYSRLTGALVQVPSPRNATAWWQWRHDLQEKLQKERTSARPWYFAR